ncbi:hypothetical protein [Microbacterium sp. HJ5]
MWFAERIAGVADEDVAGFACAVELASKTGAIVVVSARVQIGGERSRAAAEGVSDLVDRGGCGDAEVCAGFVERHASAVR